MSMSKQIIESILEAESFSKVEKVIQELKNFRFHIFAGEVPLAQDLSISYSSTPIFSEIEEMGKGIECVLLNTCYLQVGLLSASLSLFPYSRVKQDDDYLADRIIRQAMLIFYKSSVSKKILKLTGKILLYEESDIRCSVETYTKYSALMRISVPLHAFYPRITNR